ncbi:response regulator [Helicobacter trogontum]|uniref:Response regulator n=1 Tax=Helicobacter trogontum TaxID=50960 RepID=A0A4V6I3A2_9HELI|nr:response regulator [Helicobacter trogontum]MDY5185235.1 response regulator [Helicobacter trogontum]TLD99212.1 response regulator [Helicobacter trogontum]
MKNTLNEIDILKHFTILYAEDDFTAQQTLASILGDYFGNVIVAKDGLEAWEIFQANQIDIVLTDIVMPRYDGIKLMSQIRDHAHKDVPIVLISALTETHYFLDAIKLGCNGYLLKPIKIDDLLDTLHNAILPFTQNRIIEMQNHLLIALNTLFGGKKVEIVQYLFTHCDNEQIFYGTHDEIAEHLNTTRQTVAQCFKDLAQKGLLQKIRNKTYKLGHISDFTQTTMSESSYDEEQV